MKTPSETQLENTVREARKLNKFVVVAGCVSQVILLAKLILSSLNVKMKISGCDREIYFSNFAYTSFETSNDLFKNFKSYSENVLFISIYWFNNLLKNNFIDGIFSFLNILYIFMSCTVQCF